MSVNVVCVCMRFNSPGDFVLFKCSLCFSFFFTFVSLREDPFNNDLLSNGKAIVCFERGSLICRRNDTLGFLLRNHFCTDYKDAGFKNQIGISGVELMF